MAKPAAIEARKAKALEELAARTAAVEAKLDLILNHFGIVPTEMQAFASLPEPVEEPNSETESAEDESTDPPAGEPEEE